MAHFIPDNFLMASLTFIVLVDNLRNEIMRKIIKMVIERVGGNVLRVRIRLVTILQVLSNVHLIQSGIVQAFKMFKFGGDNVGDFVVILSDAHTDVAYVTKTMHSEILDLGSIFKHQFSGCVGDLGVTGSPIYIDVCLTPRNDRKGGYAIICLA